MMEDAGPERGPEPRAGRLRISRHDVRIDPMTLATRVYSAYGYYRLSHGSPAIVVRG